MRKVTYRSKIFFIETKLKQGYARLLFKNNFREMINVLTIAVIHFFSKWRSSRISQLKVFCEKVVLEISQNLQQKICACGVTCNFIQKETLLQVLEICKNFKGTIMQICKSPYMLAFI